MPLVLPGQEVSLNEPGRTFERHHHLCGYAALVVEGTCEEAGDRGRFTAQAGDVLAHRPLDAHRDRIGAAGALIINFELAEPLDGSFGRVSDVDEIVRAHERDPHQAAAMLRAQFRPCSAGDRDWPDMLAEDLVRPGPIRLDGWAANHGLSPNSLSRGFRLAYGITPKRYRFEQMSSRAARIVRSTPTPLSMVAADAGFADQAHMTRAMAALFGLTPRRLRRLS
jgi:AraC-like DNA-binding protein